MATDLGVPSNWQLAESQQQDGLVLILCEEDPLLPLVGVKVLGSHPRAGSMTVTAFDPIPQPPVNPVVQRGKGPFATGALIVSWADGRLFGSRDLFLSFSILLTLNQLLTLTLLNILDER